MTEPTRIAFFGGTFDPIHEGHLVIAQKAVEALKLEQVIFMPCRRSPHKTESPGANNHDRLKMLKLATEPYPWAIVDDYELKKPPPSYTWETIRHLKDQYSSKAQFYLLIGFDQWEALPRWKNIETLAQEVEFIAVGRGKQPSSREGYQAHFIPGENPASASQIRADIRAKKAPRWLPEKVAQFISDNSLYSLTP